jgi:hypothetical protein
MKAGLPVSDRLRDHIPIIDGLIARIAHDGPLNKETRHEDFGTRPGEEQDRGLQL